MIASEEVGGHQGVSMQCSIVFGLYVVMIGCYSLNFINIIL